MTRPSLDRYLMNLAEAAAVRSTCIRRSVGCVLADARGRVLAVAYNGVPSGQPHCNEWLRRRIASVEVQIPSDQRASSYLGRALSPAACLDKALSDNPDLMGWLGGKLTEPQLESSSVKGHVAVSAVHYPYACQGHDLPAGQDGCGAVHAEQNAILQCGRPDDIATAYVTLSPCRACAKLLMNTGCRRVVFLSEHDPAVGVMWSKLNSREWYKLLPEG